MRIGLVSDSHGKTDVLKEALSLLIAAEAEAIVHCGDICCLASVRLLNALAVPAWLVAGNVDSDLQGLGVAGRNTNITFSQTSVEVPLGDDATLIATHGHHEALLDSLIRGQQFPYVCHGHTHRMKEETVGTARVICPGALSGPRYPSFPTAAIVDTGRDAVEFYDISRPGAPMAV